MEAAMMEPSFMTVEMDRQWYRVQMTLMVQQIDRIQSGVARPGDMSLRQVFAELEICTQAFDDLKSVRSRRSL